MIIENKTKSCEICDKVILGSCYNCFTCSERYCMGCADPHLYEWKVKNTSLAKNIWD